MDLLCVFLISACHWPSGEQAAAVQCSRGCCDGAVTVLFCKPFCPEDGCWLLGHVWFEKELLQGAHLKPRDGCVVVAGRVVIAEDLVGWTASPVSSGLPECHSCRVYLTDLNKTRLLVEFSIALSPQGSFIAVRVPGLAGGVQTVTFPRSYCLLRSLLTGWSRSLEEILCRKRKFGLFAWCLVSLLCGESGAGCEQVVWLCIFPSPKEKLSSSPCCCRYRGLSGAEFGLFLAVSHLLMLFLPQLQL